MIRIKLRQGRIITPTGATMTSDPSNSVDVAITPYPRIEGRACDAVIRVLERETGFPRNILERPDVEKAANSGPSVELRLRLGDQRYALEHTMLLLYDNEAADWHQQKGLVDTPHGLARILPEDDVEKVWEALCRRIDAKKPKLKMAQDSGDRSVLVLDDPNIAGPDATWFACRLSVSDSPVDLDGIDDIFLADTASSVTWRVWPLVRAGRVMEPNRDGMWTGLHHAVASSELEDITGSERRQAAVLDRRRLDM